MSSTSTIPGSTFFENAFYIGINLEAILYGIELVLYFNTMRVFLVRRRGVAHHREATRRGTAHRSDVYYAVFSTLMLLLVTVWISTDAIFGQEMWLLNRNYPGGPMAYAEAHIATVYVDFGTTAIFILQQMTDGLMVYRCRIVWGSLRAIVVPSILWLATLVLGTLVVWASCNPRTNFFIQITAEIGLAYYSVSVFLNATLTSMICYRLVCHARDVKEYLGDKYASPYFTMITLLVESILPYTLSAIAFLVLFGVKNRAAIAFFRVYVLMTCVMPQMLILRVAQGTAWQKESIVPPLSVIKLSPSGGTTSHSERRNGARSEV